jgi:dihydropteroate synthase
MINDISAGDIDPDMHRIIADHKVAYIVMHMQGIPDNMQINPHYTDLIKEIIMYFSSKVDLLKKMGVIDVILDPGFGFGKTIEHNFSLMKNLYAFKIFELPILVGISRKSMIYKSLNTTPEQALNGTTSLNTLALLSGASILRVHDVKEAMETITLIEKIKSG